MVVAGGCWFPAPGNLDKLRVFFIFALRYKAVMQRRHWKMFAV